MSSPSPPPVGLLLHILTSLLPLAAPPRVIRTELELSVGWDLSNNDINYFVRSMKIRLQGNVYRNSPSESAMQSANVYILSLSIHNLLDTIG